MFYFVRIFLFIVTTAVFYVFGMACMAAASKKEIEDTYSDGFSLGYEAGKNARKADEDEGSKERAV